jgi:hypothetical protein
MPKEEKTTAQLAAENGPMIGVIDDLCDEVRIARGIEAAICGIGFDANESDDEMRRGVLQLQQEHIKRLETLNKRLVKILDLNRD